MNVERNAITGALIISDIVNGHLVTRTYFGYTKREAMRLFRAEVKNV